MKKDTSHTLKRAQRFPVILIGEGLLVGAVSGLIVMFYRIALTYAGQWLNEILGYIKGHPVRIIGWFAVLLLLAVVVGRLVKWEPMISGSGIPQVEGRYWENLPRIGNASFLQNLSEVSSVCSVAFLLEGKAVYQLGAMGGQGVSRLLDRGKDRREIFDDVWSQRGTCGSFSCTACGDDVCFGRNP